MKDYIKYIQDSLSQPINNDSDSFSMTIIIENKNLVTYVDITRKKEVPDGMNNYIDMEKMLNNFSRDIKNSNKDINHDVISISILNFFEWPVFIQWNINSQQQNKICFGKDTSLSGTKNEQVLRKTFDFIKADPNGKSLSEITILNGGLKKEIRSQIVDQLVKEEKIFLMIDTAAGRQKKVYRAIS